MRSVSARVFRGVALLTLLVVLAVPASFADDGNPNPPPDARIQPPIGVASQARIQPPIGALDLLFFVWLLAKIA